MKHPSGRPLRHARIKRTAEPRGTITGYVVDRLNDDSHEERAGGCGFVIFGQQDDDDAAEIGAFPTTARRSH